jgi:pimeloyl-ACP methyl ester carboxylesterase
MPFVEVNGTRLYYRLVGDGFPVVMVSGLGSDHAVWGYQVRDFRKEFCCLVFDNRGSGQSGVGELSLELLADDMAALMDSLGIPLAHILGTSMGGAIAMHLALRHPEKVLSLSLNSTWAMTDPYQHHLFDLMLDIAGDARAERERMAILRRLLFLLSFTPQYISGKPEQASNLLATSLQSRQPVENFTAQVRACITHDINSKLHKICVPALVSVGQLDALTPPHLSSVIHDGIKHSVMEVLPDLGHAAFMEEPETFNRLHLDFWKSLENRA